MTPFEKCQSFITLQNARLERFDRTRTIQWNFNGIFWTGIVVATAFFASNENISFSWPGIAIADIIFLTIHYSVIKMIQASLDYDKSKIAEYTMLAERELGRNKLSDDEIIAEAGKANSEQRGRTKDWLITQLFISLLLLIISTIIILS